MSDFTPARFALAASILSCERRYYTVMTLADDSDHPMEEKQLRDIGKLAIRSIYNGQSEQVVRLGQLLERPTRCREVSLRQYILDIGNQMKRLNFT